jgi:hypothetical protein
MNFFNDLQMGVARPGHITLEEVALSLLLAFVLSQTAAWVYMHTHQGLSYSRSFVQSIISLSVILVIGLMVIGTNIAIAFGLVGALSVIRFRNILKDTRDTSFMFYALINSMACGTRHYGVAIIGTATFCLLSLYLHWSQFGSRSMGDAFLRFQWDIEQLHRDVWQQVLKRHCRFTQLVSQRMHATGGGEVAYRLVMRDPAKADLLVKELRAIEGVHEVSFVLQEEAAEV